ncbi:MAG: N-6 DNA methylase [bacterium]|nr:N-6 DNA methylase [bacterium]
MLDATTKRKIDSARDILVGKVPDPKAQVEQITTALVYKFMDDMDKESQELGGKAKFFTNGFEKYSWTKLLDKRLSGTDRLDLYVQAITNMSKNPHIPQLFRDIFKDAFLPYRDPETLSLFLKEIDNFSYDHSEDLGNAFEYLLSVLGSQGDAGQFRTPRHIIDFIVEVVDPKRNETVLDPACGTAGFLISAFKHIRKHNSSNFKAEREAAEDKLPEGETIAETVLTEKTYRGDLLTPSEKQKLMNHFVGYDISPDMVKLSLVNLYLHGFSDPKIYEYDTLTSEKHWGEQFDVIMANPPFMTPKGGIRPHKRFSVQASRSEVLFVDYILEHLNLKGRAGIIVPEGIIFKTENAYKQLRQMLIEDGLFAVVSLPQGVFNPYAGVKTSILLFDNQLAKKSDEILFVKIENDGFDLGAQRRKIDKNDLPEASEVLEAWKQGKKKESGLALWVKKDKIAENGDYNLAGERYIETEARKNQKWPEVEIGKVVETITPPKKIKKIDFGKSGKYPIVDQSQDNIAGWSDDEEALIKSDKPLVVFGDHTCVVKYFEIPFVQGADGIKVLKANNDLLPIFLYYLLRNKPIKSGSYKRHFTKLKRHKIPLPPIEVQKEIVEQIEVKQKAIDAAREVIKNLERERDDILAKSLES